MSETLKITLPSALDAGVDFLKLGELRVKVTTKVVDELVRLNINLVKTATINILGGNTQFCNSSGDTSLGTTASLNVGGNILYFKPKAGVFYLSLSDKFAISQLGDSMFLSLPTNSPFSSKAVVAELDLKDLFYTPCVRLRGENVFMGDLGSLNKKIVYCEIPRTTDSTTKVTGTLSATSFDYANLTFLNLTNQAIKGNVTGLSFSNITVLRLTGTELSGEIIKSNISTKLAELTMNNTDIKFNLSILSDAAATMGALSISGSLAYGNIEALSTFSKALSDLKGLNLSGDFSKLHNDVYFLSNVNSSSTKNANSHLSTTYWTNKKADRQYIMALESVRIVTGVDQYLIDMAALELHPSSITGGAWNRTINIRGSRTAASDVAVATLQNKGLTVVLSSTN